MFWLHRIKHYLQKGVKLLYHVTEKYKQKIEIYKRIIYSEYHFIFIHFLQYNKNVIILETEKHIKKILVLKRCIVYICMYNLFDVFFLP